jgi:hypothetical protein
MFNYILDRRVHRARRAGTGEVNEPLSLLCGTVDSPPFHSLLASK